MFVSTSIAIVLLLGLLFVASLVGRLHSVAAIVTLAFFFRHSILLGGSQADTGFVGISRSAPVLATYTLAVMLLLVDAARRPSGSLHWNLSLPFISYLVVMFALVWPKDWQILAGLVHLSVGALGLQAGAHVASLVTDALAERRLFNWIAGVSVFQLSVSALQFVGVPVFYNAAVLKADATLAGRSTGTFYHPSTLGKVCFLLSMMALPAIGRSDIKLRRLGWIAIISGMLATVFTGARANALAIVAVVALWVVFSRSSNRWQLRVRLVAMVSAITLVSLPYWQYRVATGEDGTYRSHYESVAWLYIKTHSMFGSGPNSYVRSVAPYDSQTALGWSVHNVYLLAGVELGIAGAVLVAALSLVPVVVAVGRWWASGVDGEYARVLIASLPGLLIINTTGWGMLADAFAPWMFATGFCYARMFSQGRTSRSPGLEAPPSSAAIVPVGGRRR